MSKYWQHDETGRIAITRDDVDLLPRYYEISQEAYEHIEATTKQSIQTNIIEIWCNGKLHYTRPEGHPDIQEALDLIERCKNLFGVAAYEVRPTPRAADGLESCPKCHYVLNFDTCPKCGEYVERRR